MLGRVQTSTAQREAVLDEFERSGLCGTKFAQVAGVNYHTFASWVQKRRRATGAYNRSNTPEPKKTAVRAQASALPTLGWHVRPIPRPSVSDHPGTVDLRLTCRMSYTCAIAL